MEPKSRRYILLVDDNAEALELLADALGMLNYEVTGAADGQSALAIAKVLRPDFALIDIGLPDMSGCELARALRRQPGWQNVTLIALTGYDRTSDREATEQAGFAAHLVKPISLKVLQETLSAGLLLERVDPKGD